MLLPAVPWLLPAAAAAEHTAATLRVVRDEASASCADENALKQRVGSIVQHQHWADEQQAVRVDFYVRFSRDADGAFVARVEARGSKVGRRLLRDQSPNCEALSQAVSVAIALLLDSAPSDQGPSPVVEPNESTPESTPAPTRADDSRDPERASGGRSRARAMLGGGGGYGLGGAGALLGEASVGLVAGRWRLELSGFATLPASSDYRAGSVRTSLIFGSVRGCFFIGRGFALGPCVELGVGRLRGEGDGFEQAQPSNLPWTAGGLGLGAEAPLTGGLFLRLGATLWVPTRRYSFSVQNAGIAWESKPVAAILSAALGLSLF